MLRIGIHLSISIAVMMHTLVGCCHHGLLADGLLHGPAREIDDHGHAHGDGHGPASQGRFPVEHEDHDCHCEWVNNSQVSAAPLMVRSLEVAYASAITCGIGFAFVSQAASFRERNIRLALPLRAHLALCRLLL